MWGFLVGWKDAAPAASALIAAVSAVVAFLAFVYARRANRRRATLDMVMRTLLDDSARKNYEGFRQLIRKNEDTTDCFKLASLAEPDAIGSENRNNVLGQLNVYELMALGINRGLFDESFYKRWYHNQFMTDHEGAKDFIDCLQGNKKSIYCESTALYTKWLRNGHPESSPNRFKMAWWAFRKQHEKIDAARAQANAR